MGTDSTIQAGALITREDFGGRNLSTVTDTAAAAVTARETALIQSRLILAQRNRRDLEQVRANLKLACQIFAFADEAWYSRPSGGDKPAEGFSIRFAEEAGRTMGNLMSDQQVAAETTEERLIHVWAMDLETNFTRGMMVVVPKVIERKYTRKGQTVVGERVNSKGDTVYLVEASRDEVNQLSANLCARAERQCILKMIPSWIQSDCKATILATLEKEDARNPEETKRKLIDGFAGFRIMPTDLAMYLGHSLDRVSPKELTELRGVYRAIQGSESTWEEILELKRPTGSQEAADEVRVRRVAEAAAAFAAKPTTSATADATATSQFTSAADVASQHFATEDNQMTILSLAGDRMLSGNELRQVLIKHGVEGGDLKRIPAALVAEIVDDLTNDAPPRDAKPLDVKPPFSLGSKKG